MTRTQINLTIIAIIMSAVILHISTGMSAVLFPLTLEKNALGTTFIGIVLAMEFLAVLPVSKWLTPFVSRLGLVPVMLLACLVRFLGIILFYFNQSYPVWCLLVFVYGIGGFVYLIALQTWINSLELSKNRGFVLGILGTSISVGLGVGPLILQFIPIYGSTPFYVSAAISFAAFIPLLLVGWMSPAMDAGENIKVMHIVKRVPAIMGAGMFAGLMIFGLLSFLLIYGLQNKLTPKESAFLLTMFMAGSFCLEAPIASLSDRFDRRYVIIISVFLSLVCATYLPIAIYTDYLAWGLLFVWGGVSGGIYSICLAIIGDRFRGEELVAANSAYAVMDATGGVIGTLMIGGAMALFGSDGLPYVIVLAGIVYFTYALTRYKVQ